MAVKSSGFWDTTPCSSVRVSVSGGTSPISSRSKDKLSEKSSRKQVASWFYFGPECGGYMFLRNVG
jgi:hypothetical protein